MIRIQQRGLTATLWPNRQSASRRKPALCSSAGALALSSQIGFTVRAISPDWETPPCPPSIDAAINLDDLRKLAKRRLPKIAYDFIEGGLDDEDGLARNEDAFKRYRLVPRYGVDVTTRDQSTTLFGRTYSGPVGIAPTGGRRRCSGAAAT